MKAKILIVEDNENSLYLMETLLKGHGAEVISARNGQEALEKALQDPPELVISDILMPVMDGFTLCRLWKSHEKLKDIPFVFYTATYTDPRDEEFALSLGADRFFIKPQDPDILMNLLKEVIEEALKAKKEVKSPLGEEMEFFRKYNETLFRKLEKKMLDLEITNQKLRILEEKYRLSFENVADVILTFDTQGTITAITPSLEKILGYHPQQFIGREITSLEKIFTPDSFKEAMADFKRVLSGETFGMKIYGFLTANGTLKYGEISGSPILSNAQVLGVICVARDITDRLESERRLREATENLNKVMKTTIQVIMGAIESRDPYTAGHQLRSAHLAQAIATKMKLPQEKIDAIYMAGSIHDIGKISVPVEILVKPSKLTELEYSLVKEHARIGFEILKKVESPWPLAEIVYQHHERLDGSGYPRNLKDDEILLEARILSVADVVEAMASHRPYRPALGIDASLKEIEEQQGILYDAEVVNACLQLFRKDGYQLPQAEWAL
ncbi:MAG: PAS domain S-box protein [Candidatus Aminicenantes bacterium]|nr:PAS domain S-box protein [Candidatus Aminicenantes bacterium]